ncbi:MAG: hypothetical protein KGI97_02715 [Alphaproteobacteria bacterium]|nr:hypothetical protein [Alphaproteobacteria bacterium]
MRRFLIVVPLLCLLAACEQPTVAQFWRPISEPNLLMPSDQLQKKLAFDLGQCHCGIYPANATRSDIIKFSADKQRLAQTSVTVTPDEDGQCVQQPSLVVTECMRERGWEPTECSGRMPLPGGGSLCASYHPDEGE